MIRKTIFNLSLILFSATVFAQAYFPTSSNWENKKPNELGLNNAKIARAVAFAEANEYSGARDLRIAILEAFKREPFHDIQGPTKERGGPAGLILKDGYIIASWGDTERVDMTFSVTKSYLSTTTGLAIDDGLISSVKAPTNKYIWDGTFAGTHNAQITWEHLLHQTSDWSGTHFGLQDWADRPDPNQQIDEWRNRVLHPPGSHFKYNDVRVNVLSYAMLNVWRKPLPQVLKDRIMDPIGASTTWRWYGYENSWITIDGIKMESVSGGGHHGGGMFINTLDQARFGLLFARNGKWNEQQLISKEWVNMVQTPATANESYGYMWWLNRGERNWENVPDHLFYAAGFGGNFIVVDQEKDLVIVTRWLEPSKIGELVRLVYED